MIILLVGKSRTPATQGSVATIRVHRVSPSPVVRQWRRVPRMPHNSTSAIGMAADVPLGQGVVRAAMMGSLPLGKHVVGNVDGASCEGDAAVQHHV
jgi:hypothetical protein